MQCQNVWIHPLPSRILHKKQCKKEAVTVFDNKPMCLSCFNKRSKAKQNINIGPPVNYRFNDDEARGNQWN